MVDNITVGEEINQQLGDKIIYQQKTKDDFPTIWVERDSIVSTLNHLKNEIDNPYRMLYDLTVIDERSNNKRNGLPNSDFSVVYHLLSFDRNEDIRLKVPLKEWDHFSFPKTNNSWNRKHFNLILKNGE
ncbi:MAG: NADH-quinone oxidoreductase subunit C [Ignavibacteriaceae bacterium]